MFIIPGWLIAYLTFPGVIVHEAAHKFFCDLANVPVFSVCYFQKGTPSGYVIHATTSSLRANLLISIGPLIVNTLLCALLCFTPAVVNQLDEAKSPFVFFLLGWLGISIGMHAFPSSQDMNNFSDAVKRSERHDWLRSVAVLFNLFIRLANLLRIIWFDLVYALAVGAAVPFALLRL